MTVLTLKEQQLKDRTTQLENSIQELKNSILIEETLNTSKLIEQKALEIQKLETQLKLTELALQNTQEKLRARKEFESSKEFKDKQKMQEKLYSESRNEAGNLFKKLGSFVSEIEEVFEKVRQADNILYELSEEKDKVFWSFKERAQPFSGLREIQDFLNNQLQDLEYRKQKLEV